MILGEKERLAGATVHVGSHSAGWAVTKNPTCGNAITLEQIRNADQEIEVICNLEGRYLTLALAMQLGDVLLFDMQAFTGQCEGMVN